MTNHLTKTTQLAKSKNKQNNQPALMFGGTGGQIPSIDLLGVTSENGMTFE